MAHERVPANPPTAAHAAAHGHEPAEHPHPTWSTYWKVALVLTVITIIEVWAYYIPQFVASRAFVPSLLIMSARRSGGATGRSTGAPSPDSPSSPHSTSGAPGPSTRRRRPRRARPGPPPPVSASRSRPGSPSYSSPSTGRSTT